MTNQQIFDAVTAHLRKQGRAAVLGPNDENDGKSGNCRYRIKAADGTILMCAVGCLIKDEHYDPRIEGAGAVHWRVIEALEESLGETLTVENKLLLHELQDEHDIELSVSLDEWEKGMQALALRHNLTYTPVA